MGYRRAVQLKIPFPISCLADVLNFEPVGKRGTLMQRQPRKFPPGWHRLSLTDPDWRAKHYAAWSAKRAALGLPAEVRDVA